jgi:hypothetical protein
VSVISADSQKLEDPTRPLINTFYRSSSATKSSTKQKVPTKQKLVLQGIFLRSEGSRAVIDNQLLKVGDKINQYTVQKIYAQRVILRRGQQTKTLQLNSVVKAVNKKG